MAHTISASTCLDAWKDSCTLILRTDIFNLIVEISNPSLIDQSWFDNYSPDIYDSNSNSLKEVVNTIFPYKQFVRNLPRATIYKLYKRAHKSTARSRRWGTYFLRMIEFGASQTNQLDKIIVSLAGARGKMSGTNFIHITSVDISSNVALRGAPCMQYVQFILHQTGEIDLVAVYRNHDYFSRAFGNFIGLSYLLQFVCRESGKNIGKIVCHSIHAYNSSNSRNLQLLKN